ncbi:MAG: hypothetical protein BGN85_03485 [Alphaproteobacteria bacterium 64-11]|nr:hypothetical protein [Alphaproteobacteria bacterium]OJU10816.1 MAG: hypothetical protein BGN85_03485 [Alphaproteobacteria bacterium 64-11]
MGWRKLGLVFCPDGAIPWMHSHAALPFAVPLEQDIVRVFFSARDRERRSHVGFLDMQIGARPKVLMVSQVPALAPGAAGAFDDSGIGLGCVADISGQAHLYYMGWNLGVTAPWRNSIGLALGDTRIGVFERISPGPIMDRSPQDPYTLSYPWVLRNRHGGWRMWYGSNLSWGADAADMNHVIKSATSADGITWQRDGTTVIGAAALGEIAFARPCVLDDGDLFRMWYAFRGEAYRIGYAESVDGRNWERRDADVGIDVSPSGWDSEMLCYPCVFNHGGARYMLYNGNGYGATGFGLAIQD